MNKTAIDPTTKAFHYKSFRFFWFAILSMTLAVQVLSVSVAWQVYDMTRDPLFLGYVGLSQFLPAFLLVLVTGITADRFPRRLIMLTCLSIELVCAAGLFSFVWFNSNAVWQIYVVLILLGVARAFLSPASASLAPNLVPPKALANALAINSSAWQTASIVGPALGGILYGFSATIAYGTGFMLIILAMCLVAFIAKPAQRTSKEPATLDTLFAGFKYVWKEKIIFGAISLDMFAVFLGGAFALMPVYARDILEVGPWGLGLLRASPGIGAVCMALVLARIPIRKNAGVILFFCVAGFGVMAIIFGFSKTVWVAVPALLCMGAFDVVSVILRETILQLWTPDEVRGRVSAVNSVFLGASNELGEFRAGFVAAKWGTVFAVTIGGAGTIAVAGLWSYMFPQLRKQQSIVKRMI